MRKIFKISIVFILVLSMITGMGLSAYTTDTDETVSSIDGESEIVQDEQEDNSREVPAEQEDSATDLDNQPVNEGEQPVGSENPEEQPVDQNSPPVDPNVPPIMPSPPVSPTANPSIYAEVSTEKDSYLAGEVINYTIRIINTGNVALEGITLEDGLLGQKVVGNLGIGEELELNEKYWIQENYNEEMLSNSITVLGYYGEIEVISGSSFTIMVVMYQGEKLNYIVKYFLNGEEQFEWEIINQVPVDNPIVEVVPHDNMPEGYIVDEELSTVLPFMVTENENVIEVYYILELEGLSRQSVMLMALISQYESDTPIFPLHDTSINDHTKTKFAWMFEGDLYLALYSHPTKPITGIKYNGVTITPKSIDRAANSNDPLKIHRIGYSTETYLVSSTANPKPLWTVINLGSNVTLSSKFDLYIDTGSPGHNVSTTVYIANSLLVYHSYDGSPLILDTDQSGGLTGSPLGYMVQPKYDYGGDSYELEKFEVIHNGISLGYFYPSNLDSGGYFRGTVQIVNFNASAEIRFYYVKAADGQLTITKDVNGIGYNPNQEFDIFIYGPNGKKYVVTLIDEESITLTGLEYGNYSVKEVVPMNYKLAGMTNGGAVTISKTNKHQSVTVNNEYTNDGWFFDDDPKINSFTVGGGISQKPIPVEGRLAYLKLEYFLVPAALEIDFRGDNV